MKLYVWSDHHYFHKNIIKYQNRPFECSFKGMIDNAKLMYNNHKNIVKKNDIVLYLGDFALIKDYTKNFISEMFKSLPGYKFLIRGNHDRRNNDFYKNLGFIDIFDYLIINKFFICHYPIDSNTPNIYKQIFLNTNCNIIIHGHLHANNPINDIKIDKYNTIEHINVCVDYKNNNYLPIEFKDKCLINYFKKYLRENI